MNLLIGTCELAIVYNYNTASESSNVPRTYGAHQPQSKIEVVLYHGTFSGTSGGTPTPPNTLINLFVLLISTNIGTFLLEWEAMSMDVVRCNTPGHVVSLFASRIKKYLVVHPTVKAKDSGSSNKDNEARKSWGRLQECWRGAFACILVVAAAIVRWCHWPMEQVREIKS